MHLNLQSVSLSLSFIQLIMHSLKGYEVYCMRLIDLNSFSDDHRE